MANKWGGDPRVKEWMKEHKEEVAKVQYKYNVLKEYSTEELIEMAPGDVMEKVRGMLIAKIITAESAK